MAARGFLIAHGWQNRRPADHWEHWLADRLAEQGHRVRYPQFPEPDEPVLGDWLAVLRAELGELDGAERVVVCHSLAVLLWLNAAPALGDLRPDRVLLVAPPSAAFCRERPVLAGFAQPGIETTPLEDAVRRRARLVAGTGDPYCPEGADRVFGGPLGLDTDVLPGAGHLDLVAGYGPWPAVLDWCGDPAVRLTARRP